MSLPSSITLEEHFTSRASHSPGSTAKDDPRSIFPPHITDKLIDLHSTRIENMDANNVAIQVISHTPSASMTAESISASNDELAAAIRQHPTRLAGFAQLPMSDPTAAACELERCVAELRFVGTLVDNHTDGNFYDGAEHEMFWAKAQELDVPVYLHPTWPSESMVEAMYSGGGLVDKPSAGVAIGAFAFGWHASTATTVLRLLASGVFDRFPKLKIIIGHSGELLPYMFERIDRVCGRFCLQRGFREVMHSNIWITTSGMFDTNSLQCLLGVIPLERVMFSVDYPFSDNSLGKEYLLTIQKKKIMNDQQLQAFAYDNANNLLFKGKTSQ